MGPNLGLVFVCIALGFLLQRLKVLPPDAGRVVNRLVVYVSLPAITLLSIHRMEIPGGQALTTLLPATMPWLFFGLGWAFFGIAGRLLGWSPGVTGALLLTASLGNTSFVGFPLIEAFYGRDALAVAVLVDQPGSFLVLGTLGILVASLYAGGSATFSGLLSRILKFPPFLSVVLAFALRPWAFPYGVAQVLEKLAATLIPLALISVGLQLQVDPGHLRRNLGKLAGGLAFKLALAPALMAGLYLRLLPPMTGRITVLEAAMAPMVTASIVATERGLDADLANVMVGVGIPLSLLTVLAWKWLLER